MTSARSILLVGLLAAVAGLGLWTTHRHYAARDAEAAIVSLMTHRFDGTTRSRMTTWLSARREAEVGLRISTQAHLPGPFDDAVAVDLQVDDATYRFSIGIRDRTPRPLDASAASLIARLRAEVAPTTGGK